MTIRGFDRDEFRAWRARGAIVISGALAFACSYPLPQRTEHVVSFAKDGLPVEYRADDEALAMEYGPEITANAAYEEHLRRVVSAMERFHGPSGTSARKPILLYLHGGLNSYETAYSRADSWVDENGSLIADSPAYPIFVCWHSSLWSSYADHLLFVRQGRHRPVLGAITSPVFLVADLGRSILRAPFVWSSQVGKFCTGTFGNHDDSGVYGRDCRSLLDKFGSGASYVLTLPLKIVGTLFVDALGTSAWEMMQRRTRLLFAPEDPADGRELTEPKAPFVEFLAALAAYQRATARDPKATGSDILVAHSMGAIVANRMLRLAVARPDDFPRFRKIVYVAPACSVADCIAATVSYLHLHRDAELEIHVLHPEADRNEIYFGDLAPRGSLLDWLDQFLDKPLTPRDRVIGKRENLIPALGEFGDDILSRIRVLGGDYGCDCVPNHEPDDDESPCRCASKQTHGGIADCVLAGLRSGASTPQSGREIAACEVQASYSAQLVNRIAELMREYGSIDAIENELTRPKQSEPRSGFVAELRRLNPLLPAPIRAEVESRDSHHPPLDEWIEEVAKSRAVNGAASEPPVRDALRRSLQRLFDDAKAESNRLELEAKKHREDAEQRTPK